MAMAKMTRGKTTPQGNNKLVKYEIFIPPKTVDLADQGDNKFQVEVIAVASTPKNPWVDPGRGSAGRELTARGDCRISKASHTTTP